MQSKRFVVLMMARSGSTWLVTLLNGQPGVAAYEELLLPHPVNPKYAWLAADAPERLIARRPDLPGSRPRRLARYLSEVEAHRPGAATSGFKVNATQIPGMPELLPVLALRGYRLVVLLRENVFESSVSVMANRLGGDAHGRELGDQRRLTLDPEELLVLVRRRLRWFAALRMLRALWPWPSVAVSYEDLVADQTAALAPVLRAIGAPAAPIPVQSPLKRRVNQPYADMITNYEEVAAALQRAGLARYLPPTATT
jgi:LPS sulfotransferase NodH